MLNLEIILKWQTLESTGMMSVRRGFVITHTPNKMLGWVGKKWKPETSKGRKNPPTKRLVEIIKTRCGCVGEDVGADCLGGRFQTPLSYFGVPREKNRQSRASRGER